MTMPGAVGIGAHDPIVVAVEPSRRVVAAEEAVSKARAKIEKMKQHVATAEAGLVAAEAELERVQQQYGEARE